MGTGEVTLLMPVRGGVRMCIHHPASLGVSKPFRTTVDPINSVNLESAILIEIFQQYGDAILTTKLSLF
jgi:hypothetical protein